MRKFFRSATENSVTLQGYIFQRKAKFRRRWHKGQKVTRIYIICRTLVSQYIIAITETPKTVKNVDIATTDLAKLSF